jgi:hypothetical protein
MLNGPIIDITNPVATPDPNVTQPPDTTVTVLPLANGQPSGPWIVAMGGAPTIQFWAAPLGDSPPTWFVINFASFGGSSLTLPADQMISGGALLTTSIPAGMPIHVQVTAQNGATRIIAGLMKS